MSEASKSVQCPECGERWGRTLLEAFPTVPGCPACRDWATLTSPEHLKGREAEMEPHRQAVPSAR